MTRLTTETIDCLSDRLAQINDHIEDAGNAFGEESRAECAQSWSKTIAQINKLLANPTHRQLSKLAEAADELKLYRDYDGVRADLRIANFGI